MDYSTRISERMWNQPDKGILEAERENTFIDDIVQKSHIEKELLASIDGIESIECLNCATINTVNGTEATFDIQIQITYREE